MAPRLDLQDLLTDILGSENVYLQSPNNTQMQYPCILYSMNGLESKFADNTPYTRTKRYQVMVIDRNPDSEIPDKISALPMCLFDRQYAANNLNHFVFNLYF